MGSGRARLGSSAVHRRPPPNCGQRGCAVSEKREEPSGFLERAPSGMTSGLGLVGRVFQLDTELLLGAGGAEGRGMFWGGGRQTVALPRVSRLDHCRCSLPSGVLPCCAPHLVSGVR